MGIFQPFQYQVPSLISLGFIAEGYSLEVACGLCCWSRRTTHCHFITLVLNPKITGCRAAQNKHAAVLSPESAYDIILDIFWLRRPRRNVHMSVTKHSQSCLCCSRGLRTTGAIKGRGCSQLFADHSRVKSASGDRKVSG